MTDTRTPYDIDKLNTAIMNIPCSQSHVYFGTAREYYAYKGGHKEARHAAVDAVREHFKDDVEPSVSADERALPPMPKRWQDRRDDYPKHEQPHSDYLIEQEMKEWREWGAALASKYDAGVVQSQTERMQSPAVSQKDGAVVEMMKLLQDAARAWNNENEPALDAAMEEIECFLIDFRATPAATVDAPADTTVDSQEDTTTASASGDSKSEFLAHLQRASDLVETWPKWKQGMFASETNSAQAPSREAALNKEWAMELLCLHREDGEELGPYEQMRVAAVLLGARAAIASSAEQEAK
jgi:hypothetical protein